MTVGSLFSGVGGFDLAATRTGWDVRWQVEIDPFCREVLATHWPATRRYEDVRCCGSQEWADGWMDSLVDGGCGDATSCPQSYHGLERVDVICGGFPCQDLSSAGKRAGVDGERSGLWREYMRIVGELKPDWVVIENVHHAWRQWVPILRSALWARGYASLPLRLRACDFGAWHERRRVFLVAHADASALRVESWRGGWPFWPDAPLLANTGETRRASREDEIEGGESGRFQRAAITDTDPAGRADGEGRGEDAWFTGERSAPTDTDALRELQPEGRESDKWRRSIHGDGWATEPDLVRVVHGVPSRVDARLMAARIGALGNALIPEAAEWVFQQIQQRSEPVRRP